MDEKPLFTPEQVKAEVTRVVAVYLELQRGRDYPDRDALGLLGLSLSRVDGLLVVLGSTLRVSFGIDDRNVLCAAISGQHGDPNVEGSAPSRVSWQDLWDWSIRLLQRERPSRLLPSTERRAG